MNNAQVIKKLGSSPDARIAASQAANAFLKNVLKYPLLFSRCNRLIPQLPLSVLDEIASISGKLMNVEDAIRITRILDDSTCAICGKVKGKCSHGAA